MASISDYCLFLRKSFMKGNEFKADLEYALDNSDSDDECSDLCIRTSTETEKSYSIDQDDNT